MRVALENSSTAQKVLAVPRTAIGDLVRDEVKAMAARGDTGLLPELVVQFVAGGLFGLLMWWGNGKMRMPVEEVNTVFRRLAIPAVKAALR